ncbi:hypothetical protein JOB18_020040 [Solea senegalensis]|uniref:Uncharacterized protein n=1 Tax=Solea senegalensis TaxID=28829 RepID=A0AAV6Q945_SOLSE|nr:hypothetical protein JOB18_020040 [Solea senegalensis]
MFVPGKQTNPTFSKSKIVHGQMCVHGNPTNPTFSKSRIVHGQMFVHGKQKNLKSSKSKIALRQMFVPGKQKSRKFERDDVADFQEEVSVEVTQAIISTEQMDESKANLGRRDALCPWEMVRSRSGSFTDNVSDVFTWEPENIPEEDEEDDAECAAEALVFPPDL